MPQLISLGALVISEVAPCVIASTAVELAVGIGVTAGIMGAEYGISKLLSPHTAKVDAATSSINIRQDIAYRATIFGTHNTGGAITLAQVSGSNNDYLHIVYTLAGHKVHALPITSTSFPNGYVYVDGQYTTLSAKSGNYWGVNGKYQGKMWFEFEVGDPNLSTSPFPGLLADCYQAGTNKWQLGCAKVHVKMKYDQTAYGGAVPSITFDVQGKEVYDLRTSTTVFTANPALLLRDYLLDPWGMNVDSSMLVDADFIAAANVCDQQITLRAGGTQNRYECNSIVTSDMERGRIIQTLTSAMEGMYVPPGDGWHVYAGTYTNSVFDITDSMLRKGIKYDDLVSRRDKCNGIRGTYVSPSNKWKASDFPAYQSSSYLSEDGAPIWTDVALTTETDPIRAQRRAKIQVERARRKHPLTLPCKLSCLPVNVGDTVTFTHTRWGMSATTYQVLQTSLVQDTGNGNDAPSLGVDLICYPTDAGVYAWDPNVDEGTVIPCTSPVLPDSSSVQPITGLALLSDSTTMVQRNDGINQTQIKVTWTAPADAMVQSGGNIEIWVQDTTIGLAWIDNRAAGNSTLHFINRNIIDGHSYTVSLIAVNASGAHSSAVSAAVTASSAYSAATALGSSENVISNSDFAFGITDWTTWPGYGNPYVSLNAGDPSNGGKNVLWLTPMTSGASRPFRVVPGRKYHFRIRCGVTGPNVSFYFRLSYQTQPTTGVMQNPGNGAVPNGFGDFMAATNPGGWATRDYDWICPAGTYWAQVGLFNTVASGGDSVAVTLVECVPYGAIDDGSGRWSGIQAAATGDGVQIWDNVEFGNGSSAGYVPYLAGSTWLMINDPTAPNSSKWVIDLYNAANNTTTAWPNATGFATGPIGYNSGSQFAPRKFQPGHSYILRCVANLPSNCIMNAISDVVPLTWISSQTGGRGYVEYVVRADVPKTGTFSSMDFGYWYVTTTSGVITPGNQVALISSCSVMDISMTSGIDPTTGVSTGLNIGGNVIPNQPFVYGTSTWTASSITVVWPAQTFYYADGSVAASLSAGSQTFSGLAASTLYSFYPYIRLSDSTLQWAGGAVPGNGSAIYAMQAQFDGRYALTPNNYTTAATGGSGSGSGGGAGGSGQCSEGNEPVDVKRSSLEAETITVLAKSVIAGDYIRGKSFTTNTDVYRKVLYVQAETCAAWRVVSGHKVSPTEPVYLNGVWVPAYKAEGSTLDKTVGQKVSITVEADGYDECNYYLTGDNPTLIHNKVSPC